MAGKWHKKKAFILFGVGALVFIAIVVAAVIVIRSNNIQSDTADAQEEDEETRIWREEAEELMAQYSVASMKAQTLLNEDPIDVGAIVEVYDSVISDALLLGRERIALQAIDERTELLRTHGFVAEALAALKEVDYSAMTVATQIKFCDGIINLSRELNDEASASEYQEKKQEIIAKAKSEGKLTDKDIELLEKRELLDDSKEKTE